MRLLLSLTLAAGTLAVAAPAQAAHCSGPDCPVPLAVFVVEGIGNVCSKAAVKNTIAYGTKCTYGGTDPLWTVTKTVSSWNQPGYTDGSRYQGLFWPGAGPPAVGPYRLNVSTAVNPPANACADSFAGAGCRFDTEGKLTPGNQSGTGAPGTGAYCGSSQGRGVYRYTSSDNTLVSEANAGWDQSAATILPVYGEVTRRNGIALISGRRPAVRAFLSSRGIGGSGNCGIDQPTTGFQVEGFFVEF